MGVRRFALPGGHETRQFILWIMTNIFNLIYESSREKMESGGGRAEDRHFSPPSRGRWEASSVPTWRCDHQRYRFRENAHDYLQEPTVPAARLRLPYDALLRWRRMSTCYRRRRRIQVMTVSPGARGPQPSHHEHHINVRRLPWLLSSLESPKQVVGYLGPNWFASIMGTGIVANAAATLPVQIPGLHGFALGVWVADALLLLVLVSAVVAHWLHHPTVARGHVYNPQMAQFYGAPPMALLTVGAGAVLVGKNLIGLQAAVDLDWVLWVGGTLGGLYTAVFIPYLLFTQHNVEADAAFGGWLMPVVPPMVSAATGALLIPHIPEGAGRATLLYACYSMFGLALVASIIIITLIWSRLAHYGISGTSRVPTLWIVLGPLGQSITAAGLLGTNASLAVGREVANGMNVMAILYGVPVWGFAVLWITLATMLTIRTARRKLPFALTWWSFTFPVGTFVTGTTGLAVHTALPAFRWAAVVAYCCLLAAWGLVAVRTAHGSLRGELFRAPENSGPIRASKDLVEGTPSS